MESSSPLGVKLLTKVNLIEVLISKGIVNNYDSVQTIVAFSQAFNLEIWDSPVTAMVQIVPDNDSNSVLKNSNFAVNALASDEVHAFRLMLPEQAYRMKELMGKLTV
ncbi:hypothetical protein RIF29_14890 [Crotalaria pallida]|uniref:Uncharacterized protein n=1 Tax=Crotalaria pallida TaxID=3830 RepID=A0AAN9FGA6_CROPI